MAKGQSVSLDLMFGVFIFLLVFTYSIIVLAELSGRYAGNSSMQAMELAAMSTANRLVMSGGEPFNWSLDAGNAKAVGFAQMPGVLDRAKLEAFETLSGADYATAKQAIGIDNDFLVVVDENDGTLHMVAGMQERNASAVVEIGREAVLDGRHVNVKVRVYGENR